MPHIKPTEKESTVKAWGRLESKSLVADLNGIIAKIKEGRKPELRLTVWDFAEQLVFRVVHHSFFTLHGLLCASLQLCRVAARKLRAPRESQGKAWALASRCVVARHGCSNLFRWYSRVISEQS